MFEHLRAWMASYAPATAGKSAVKPQAAAAPAPRPAATAGTGGGISSLEDLAGAFYGSLLRPKDKEPSLSGEVESAIYRDVLTVIRSGVRPEDLPKLPAAVMQLLQKLRDENTSVKDITALINQDPVLASGVLKTANSPYYRTGEAEIASIEQAVQRLGMERLSAITLECLMKPAFDIKPIYFRYFSKYLWQHSQDCAFACAELARKAGEDYFTAYLVGLVHDIGKLVIFQALMRAIKQAHPDAQPNPQLISTIVDRTSLQLSCVSLKHWELPLVVQQAVCAQVNVGEEREQLPIQAYILYCANMLSEIRLLLSEGRLDEAGADNLLAPHGLSVAMVQGLFRDSHGR